VTVRSVKNNGGKKLTSISEHKRKITLSRCRKLAERMLDWYKPEFEQYVRAYREFHGYDPDTEEVSNVWPEDVVDDDR
jgi:hypothetical protein